MFYHDEIVEASATKSRPGQSIGLELEEIDGRIYVAAEIVNSNGLFFLKDKQQQVQKGDELLEVNGIPIVEFPNSLKDVQKFLQGEWSINIRVGRNHHHQNNSVCGNSQTTEETVSTCSSSLCDDDPSSEAAAAALPQTPTLPSSRGRTRLSTEGDQPLVDHSGQQHEPQPNGAGAPLPTTKRRGRRKSRESLGSLIREVRSRTPSGRSLTPSGHGPRRGRRPGSTHSRKDKDDSSNHSRTSQSQSFQKTVSFDEQQQQQEKKPPTSPGRLKKKTTNKKKREKSKDSSNSQKKKREKTEEQQANNSNNNNKIRGVECSNSCVTLEMKDGNRVSVNPLDLMALMTEEDGKFVPISNRKLDDDKAPSVPISDDDDDDEHYDTVSSKLVDLRKVLQKNKKKHNNTTIPTMNDCSSVENPWARRSMSTLMEDHQVGNSNTTTTPTSLRRLLGERLRTINPKKWEESSMVSSTMFCFTNLIDPGDLMKIRNYTGSLNGATVEIVCKSSRIPNSWDVRVLQKKNQRASDPNLTTTGNSSARLISVSAENLRHFV